jgi:hypothetical protein
VESGREADDGGREDIHTDLDGIAHGAFMRKRGGLRVRRV